MHVLGKYRKTHIPSERFWENSTSSRQPRLPDLRYRGGRIGVYICYDRHFPEVRHSASPGEDRLQSVGDHRGLSAYLWQLEQPASAVANEYFVAPSPSRVEELGTNDFYGQSYFVILVVSSSVKSRAPPT